MVTPMVPQVNRTDVTLVEMLLLPEPEAQRLLVGVARVSDAEVEEAEGVDVVRVDGPVRREEADEAGGGNQDGEEGPQEGHRGEGEVKA